MTCMTIYVYTYTYIYVHVYECPRASSAQLVEVEVLIFAPLEHEKSGVEMSAESLLF